MFTNSDQSEFRRAEKVVGNIKGGGVRRGNYSRVSQFLKWVAQEGLGEPAFTNIGRWRHDEASMEGGEVYIPWLTVDIDNVDLVEAYEDATQTVERLLYFDYDPQRIFCSFSGNKGFHIQVDSTQLGLAPFKGPDHARLFLRAWTEDVCQGDFFDPAVCSPRSLLRVAGSTHEKSGLRKRTFRASEFLARGMNGVMKNVRSDYEGFDWSGGGKILPGPRDHLKEVYERAESNYRGQRSTGAYASTVSKDEGVLGRIRYGVHEGEDFGHRHFHVGRENAAFIMGCKLLEECDSEQVARRKLEQWNGLNKPPLQHTRLKAQWRGAKRKMNKSRR